MKRRASAHWASCAVKCSECGAQPGEGCLGDWVVKVGGVHTARVFRFKITDVLEHNDTLALDSARDRRVLVEALVEALR